jgi:hypothetical protein
MSLYPGGRKQDGANFVDALDDAALADSMALAIENAMKQYHLSIKSQPLPATGERDRRLLFVSIARGVLGYLKDHQSVIKTHVGVQDGTVDLAVDMDKS